MITDDERREVARRLREHSGVRLFTGEDVERLIGIELSDFRPEDADNSYNHLADLIEPPTQCPYYHSDRHRCSAYDDVVDRDALLALADEMEDNDVTYSVSTQYVLDDYARRIREALGGER